MKTIAETLQALRDAVALKGADYVDPNAAGPAECLYGNSDGSPACIVGHVLHAWGMNLDDLAGDVHDLTTGGTYPEVAAALREGPVVDILLEAQMIQDAGRTWGSALEAAESTARRYEDDDDAE